MEFDPRSKNLHFRRLQEQLGRRLAASLRNSGASAAFRKAILYTHGSSSVLLCQPVVKSVRREKTDSQLQQLAFQKVGAAGLNSPDVLALQP